MFRTTLTSTVPLAGLGGLTVATGRRSGRGGALIGPVPGSAVVGCPYGRSDAPAVRAARAEPADPARHGAGAPLPGPPSRGRPPGPGVDRR